MENKNFFKISISSEDRFDIAKKYYNILFTLNDIHLTKSELNLVAFSAVNGTITSPPIKEAFCSKFGIPQASVYNMIAKLKKHSIIIKDQQLKLRINPVILPDFDSSAGLLLVIKMLNNNG